MIKLTTKIPNSAIHIAKADYAYCVHQLENIAASYILLSVPTLIMMASRLKSLTVVAFGHRSEQAKYVEKMCSFQRLFADGPAKARDILVETCRKIEGQLTLS